MSVYEELGLKRVINAAGNPTTLGGNTPSTSVRAAMDEILEELREMDMASPGWLTRFKTLKHDYEHHMDEEENEVFERAKEVIGKEEDTAYGDRFLKRKAEEARLVEEKREDALED